MLITLYTNTLPNRKDRILKTMSFRWTSIEKESEEGRINFQNKVCEKVARYVVQRQLTSYLHPHIASGPSDRSDQGKPRAQWKHHKIPEISICRRRRFLDIWLTLQNRWQMKQKCSWVWEQTKKHKNVIKWHKNNCFIAYF